VAVQQVDSAPRLLSEQALDHFTRSLCAREWQLLAIAAEAGDSVTADGLRGNTDAAGTSTPMSGVVPYRGSAPFCLQERVGGSSVNSGVLVANFELTNSPGGADSSMAGQLSLLWLRGPPILHHDQCCPSGNRCSQQQDPVSTPLRKRVEMAASRVFHHLRENHSLLLTSATLEFAIVKDVGGGECLDVILVAASSISFGHDLAAMRITGQRSPMIGPPDPIDAWQRSSGDDRSESKAVAEPGHDEGTWVIDLSLMNATLASSRQLKARSHCRKRGSDGELPLPRVCRQCRGPMDVALANELKQERATARTALAKLEALQETISVLEQSKHALGLEMLRLRSERDGWTERCGLIVSRYEATTAELCARLSESVEARAMALEDDAWLGYDSQRWEQHEDRIQRRVMVLVATRVQKQRDEQTEQWRDEWEVMMAASQASADIQKTLRTAQELERDHELLTRLQTKLELVRAERDELRFQWKYVARQLTDIKAHGVQLPPRVAGGFSSYPSPSPENVRAVVKWIVDYEVKRVALEARSRTRSVGKRLKLKLELMRALAGPSSLSPVKKRKSKSGGGLVLSGGDGGSQRGLSVALESSPKKSLRGSPHRRRPPSPPRISSCACPSPASSSSDSPECSPSSVLPHHSLRSRSPPLTMVREAFLGQQVEDEARQSM
jgi:hypothetical protein